MSEPCISCTTCPSYLNEAQAAQKFPKSPGAPACSRFGHVLGKPGLSDERLEAIAETFASKCPNAGEPALVTAANYPSMRVALADEDIMIAGATPENARPASCASCSNLIPASVIQAELGWTLPLCKATGRLLFENRFGEEASVCEYGKRGALCDTTANVDLRPEYEAAEKLVLNVKAKLSTSVAGYDFDPLAYKTDIPVSSEDAARGVRAWRIVADPEGYGPDLVHPILDTDALFGTNAIEFAKIPVAGSEQHPELYCDHDGLMYEVLAIQGRERTPNFIGEAGVGKTEFVRWFAWQLQLPFESVNIHARSDYDEVFGSLMFIKGETVFVKRRVAAAWSQNKALLVDECNLAQEELWGAFRSMTDSNGSITLDGAAIVNPDTGELIVPPALVKGDWMFPFFAMNPSGDARYVGTRELSDADMSRLTPIWMNLPPVDVERDILIRRYMAEGDGTAPPAKILDAIMGIAQELRELSRLGTLPISWGIRPQVDALCYTRYFKLSKAYKRTIADFLDEEARNVVLDVVNSYTSEHD